MSDKIIIGIIGGGFVGSAVSYGFSYLNKNIETRIYDIDKNKKTHELNETLKSDFIFVCLPTPSKENGKIDISIIDKFLMETSSKIKNSILIIKSTVIPGTCDYFAKKYSLKIIHNPEFLTERNANNDFINAKYTVLGGENKKYLNEVKKLYVKSFSENMKFIITDLKTAELCKYMMNCFLATKLSFVNEIYQLSEKIGVNWNDLIKFFLIDDRIGKTHTSVPGFDGKKGYGGNCFPKDVQALIHFFKENDINPSVLESGWIKNKEIRGE